MKNRSLFPVLLLATLASPAAGQQERPAYQIVDYDRHSGHHTVAGDELELVFEERVTVPGASWLRIELADHHLGHGSQLSLLSVADGGLQVLDSQSLAQWNGGSAIFNGDTVLLQLHAAPGDRGVFVKLDRVLAGEHLGAFLTLCGSDDRTADSNNRVGRLFFGGCTAWRVTNGAFLTAGHCVDWDPDNDCGPLLPDGNLDLFGVVEFNIPSSQSNGSTVAADPDDQYPIDTSSVQWRFDGECQGLGKDWAVFAIFPNSNTGLMPHEAYGLPYRMTREVPGGAGPVRITGCGKDDTPAGTSGGGNSDNFTLQTDTGAYLGETATGTGIYHEYQVDTQGGSSGSPVIWMLHELTLGIHTNGGCDDDSGNYGTSFELNALENALHTFPGANVSYVDVGHPLPVSEDGTVYRPFDKLTEGLADVPAGGIVSVVKGTYSASSGHVFAHTTAVTIEAPCGTVTIGN